MTTNSAPMYTFGSYNSQFFPSEYLNYPIAQGMETIENLKTTNITNLDSSLSIIGNKDVVLRANGPGTVDVLSAGIATISSWNGAETRVGTASYANVTIGANGTGDTARTTTINGETMLIGSLTGTTTLNGSTMTIGSSSGTTTLNGSTMTIGGSTGTTSLSGGTVSIVGETSASFSSRTGTTTIGVVGSQVNVPGGILLGANKNLELGPGGNIQFGTGTATYAQNELGWTDSGTSSIALSTSIYRRLMYISGLQIGTYLFTITLSCTGYSVGSGLVQFQISINNINHSVRASDVGACGTGAQIPVCFSGYIKPTSTTCSFEILAQATAGSITASNVSYTIFRIG